MSSDVVASGADDNHALASDDDADVFIDDAAALTTGFSANDEGGNKQRKRPAKDPYLFGKCQVCGLDANGVHYGVESCEGCKGFFRRSVAIYTKFKCKTDGSCFGSVPLKCRRCRFHRCVQLGMKFNSTRMGRIPKHIKTNAKTPGTPISSSDDTDLLPHRHNRAAADNFPALNSPTKPPSTAASGRPNFISVSDSPFVQAIGNSNMLLSGKDADVAVCTDAASPGDKIATLAASRALLAVASGLKIKRSTERSAFETSSSEFQSSAFPVQSGERSHHMQSICPPTNVSICYDASVLNSTMSYGTAADNGRELPLSSDVNAPPCLVHGSSSNNSMLLGASANSSAETSSILTPAYSMSSLRQQEHASNADFQRHHQLTVQTPTVAAVSSATPANRPTLNLDCEPSGVPSCYAAPSPVFVPSVNGTARSALYQATLSSLAASLSAGTGGGDSDRELEIIAHIRRIIEASIAASSSSSTQYPTLDYTTKAVSTARNILTQSTAATPSGQLTLSHRTNDQLSSASQSAQMLMDFAGETGAPPSSSAAADSKTNRADNSDASRVDGCEMPLHNHSSTGSSNNNIGFEHLSILDSGGTPCSYEQQQQNQQQLLQTSADQIYSRRSADAVLVRTASSNAAPPPAVPVSRAVSLNDAVFGRQPPPSNLIIAGGGGSETPSLGATTPSTVDSSTMDKVYDGVLAFLRESATTVIQDPLRVYAYVVVDHRERMLFSPLFNQTTIVSLFTPEGTVELHRTTRDVGRLLNLVDPLRLAWTTLLLGLRYAARKYYVNKLFLDCLQAGLPLRKWQQKPSDLNEGVCVVAAHFCQRMADFVDSLPGISRLPADDRRVLTRSSMVLGWASFKALMFERNDSYLLLGNGARYNLEWMEYLIGPDVAGILCRACADMKSMRLTFAEMCLFTALMILYEKQTGITAPDAIIQLRQHYLRALQHLVQSTTSPEQAQQKLDHVQHCLLYCDELCNTCLPRIESYSFDRPFGRREVPVVESEQFIDIVEKGPV